MGGGLVLGLDSGVDGDLHIPLIGHGGVPVLDLRLNPISEGLADYGGTDIDDPPLGRFL